MTQEIEEYLSNGIKNDTHEDKLFGDHNSSEIDFKESQKAINEIVKNQKSQVKKNRQENERQAIQESPLVEAKAVSIENPTKENDIICDLPVEDTVEEEQPDVEAIPTEEQIQQKVQKLERIERALEVAKDEPEDGKINLTDPESRFMKNKGRITQSYNVQATSSEGYIVDVDITDNNACNDQRELPAALSRAEANTGKCPRESSNDAGYFHEVALEYLDKKGIDGYIPSPRRMHAEQ